VNKNPSSHSSSAIPGTTGQDVPLTPAPKRRRWLLAAVGIGALGLLAAAWGPLAQWSSASGSVSASKLTLATVERGALQRDVAGEGRVVAAAAPTLYAPHAGSVEFKVQAGDLVKRGQALALVSSPELASKLAQEGSNAESMQAEVQRAELDARQRRAALQGAADTVVQNTPVALVLVDEASSRIAFANIAARALLGGGRSLQGDDFQALLATAPEALRQAVQAGEDAVFSTPLAGSDESFHLSRRAFRLQGRPHTLYMLRAMTRELSRQEVATWKRVIRVMSHELNNSLAPISSLAHSGAELARRGDTQRLPGVFATIGERARHLQHFLNGYASVAKLPAPRPAQVDWAPCVESLAAHARFRLDGALPARPGRFDPVQVEQALLNLLKNAHEAGGDPAAVTLALRCEPGEQRIEVADRGPGMSEAVLRQALLPFYSTKREGSGLGLALAREIAEAHGGRLQLSNRAGGGLAVALLLPGAEHAADALSAAGLRPPSPNAPQGARPPAPARPAGADERPAASRGSSSS
jgi:nitrogen fixation/metabolism regulation signal transduction histidine kinase